MHGSLNSIIHYLYSQVGIVYIEWIGLEKYSAVSKEKLVMMGSTPQDMLWGERNSAHYQAAQAMKMMANWS